jgi:hypothetical protein
VRVEQEAAVVNVVELDSETGNVTEVLEDLGELAVELRVLIGLAEAAPASAIDAAAANPAASPSVRASLMVPLGTLGIGSSPRNRAIRPPASAR